MTCSFDFCNIESHLFDKLELDKIQQEGLVPTKIGRRCTIRGKKIPRLGLVRTALCRWAQVERRGPAVHCQVSHRAGAEASHACRARGL